MYLLSQRESAHRTLIINYMNALDYFFVPYYLSVCSVNCDQKRTDRSGPRCVVKAVFYKQDCLGPLFGTGLSRWVKGADNREKAKVAMGLACYEIRTTREITTASFKIVSYRQGMDACRDAEARQYLDEAVRTRPMNKRGGPTTGAAGSQRMPAEKDSSGARRKSPQSTGDAARFLEMPDQI
jgi:hypothetical protein